MNIGLLITAAAIMFAVIGGLSLVAHYYTLNGIKSRTVGDGQHGTARFATKKEIRQTYKYIPFCPKAWRKGQALPMEQGIILGSAGKKNEVTALVDTDDVHTLMIGASGVGKTAFFLYPNLEYACATGMSFLCTDTKGDLFRNYGAIARDNYGYNIAVIDLRNPTRSDGNNLLHLVNKYMDEYRVDEHNLAAKARAEKYAKIISKTIINSSGDSTIVLLSNEVQYFEELETAAKIRKYIKQKNVSQLPESIQDIIRKRQAQARTLEESAKAQIDKAIVGGAFFIYGEKIEIKYGDAKSKLDEALKQLIESVYSKLNLVNTFYDSDADILTILNSEPYQSGFAGMGSNNEFALNEISQWLEERHMSHVPVSMGDVQRRYQTIPYGWREIDIAALMARLIVTQKIEIRYGGAVVGKDDKNLVRYLRVKSEIDKASVSRRIAPTEDDMRKTVKFLREWLGQMSIAEDEDGLVAFVKDTLSTKLGRYETLLNEYSHDRYPQKDVMQNARDLMAGVLSQKNDNVALLKRLLAKQDDLLDATDDMEEIETFFKSQRPIFDSARVLQKSLQDERDYFVTDADTTSKINEVSAILGMAKPYTRIKDLSDLMQSIKTAYGFLLEQKKEEVRGIITLCMGDVHTLAGVGKAIEEVRKADDRFSEYKQKVADATSLTVLDAMITQLQNYKDQVCKWIESILHETPPLPGEEKPKKQKIVQVRRYDIFPVKRLTTKEDVDVYLETIRKKLYETLESNDGIQIN